MVAEKAREAIRPSLFYKDWCWPCRRLSWVALLLSLGHVRRVPMSSAEAAAFYAQYPHQRGRLVLIHGPQSWFGANALKAIPWVVLKTWARALAALWRRLLLLDPRDSFLFK
jgi:hypothetical protein